MNQTRSCTARPRLQTRSCTARPRLQTRSCTARPRLQTRSCTARPLLHARQVPCRGDGSRRIIGRLALWRFWSLAASPGGRLATVPTAVAAAVLCFGSAGSAHRARRPAGAAAG